MNEPHYDFNYSKWLSIYPEFQGKVTPEQVNHYASLAASYFNPTKNSVVCNIKERENIFYILVAHCAFLMSSSGDGGSLSGLINSVSEGSISIGSDTSGMSKIDPWLAQSKYGQLFWTLTKKYRSALYIKPFPDPRRRIMP